MLEMECSLNLHLLVSNISITPQLVESLLAMTKFYLQTMGLIVLHLIITTSRLSYRLSNHLSAYYHSTLMCHREPLQCLP